MLKSVRRDVFLKKILFCQEFHAYLPNLQGSKHEFEKYTKIPAQRGEISFNKKFLNFEIEKSVTIVFICHLQATTFSAGFHIS